LDPDVIKTIGRLMSPAIFQGPCKGVIVRGYGNGLVVNLSESEGVNGQMRGGIGGSLDRNPHRALARDRVRIGGPYLNRADDGRGAGCRSEGGGGSI